ncbi:hypothetical protein H6503_05845 [Candidatus Woesearchaeota archaeon]|nr:hypothetical protein [Candidatus Woesearchaeota archaeon]
MSRLRAARDIGEAVLRVSSEVVMGLLPGQDYLEKKIPGYDPNFAVNSSAAIEIGAGLFAAVHMDPAGLVLALDGLCRLNVTGNASTLGQRYCGSMLLELPYRGIQKAYHLCSGLQTR